MTDKFKVPVSMLTSVIDPGQLDFKDTSELEPLTEIIGQGRAVEALEFWLHMKSPGFDLYVSGPVGTGKGTLVRQMVKRMAQTGSPPSDWCYVNISKTLRVRFVSRFRPDKAPRLSETMAGFIDGLRRDIPLAFESKKYLNAKAKLQTTSMPRKKRGDDRQLITNWKAATRPCVGSTTTWPLSGLKRWRRL